MSTQHYEHDVFISYSHADSKVAVKIKNKLAEHVARGRTISVFLDEETIKPGDNLVDKINKGLSNAHFFLLLLSPESIDAEWPTAERDAALLQDPSGRAGRVISILVKECEIPPLLRIRKWVDFRSDADFDKNMRKIISRITGESLSHSTKKGGQMPKSGTSLPSVPCLGCDGLASMGPQLDSCGRPPLGQGAQCLAQLQWGRNLTVAEGPP